MDAPNTQTLLRRFLTRPLPLLLLGALVSLYFSYFRLPFTPIWVGSDQWGWICDASRMWGGERVYRDFFELTTPGLEVVDVLTFHLFGLKNWIPHVHVILLGLSTTWLVVVTSRKVIQRGQFYSLLPGFLFLTFAFLPTMIESYRWFSSAAMFAGLAVVMEGRTRWRLAVAGALFGLASFFTQTSGVFATLGLITFTVWEWRKEKSSRRELSQKTAYLLGAFFATVLATNVYFVWQAGMGRFFYSTVAYPLLYYPADRVHNSWHVYLSEIPHFHPWSHMPLLGRFLFIHALVPLIYFVFLVGRWRRAASREESARLMLLNIMGLFWFASVAPSPSFLRLCTVSPPALIILVYWLQNEGRFQRILTSLLWFAVFGFGVIHPMQVQMRAVSVLRLPRGRVAFSGIAPLEHDMVQWLSSRTTPGDFFFAPGGVGFLFPLALRPAGETSGYDDTDATRPEHVQSAIAALEKYHVKFIQWPPDSTEPRFYRREEDHLGPLKEYVQRNYHLVKHFDSPAGDEWEEIWERNP